ncbi:epoxide hydrolase family protein [Jannaschia sp. CCS1]|uniref:epoxide hydrolase family protein n=1 Tax=Jannaschia sp. (strain CCS1) TaxID=290400 RepID=UPI000053CA6E|nr:epoxide hydrolase family protein [Jannaschia sp. CCS1]ABD56396.1 Epoxide hydrolase-like protein [Jannaschia sp. CCS1]
MSDHNHTLSATELTRRAAITTGMVALATPALMRMASAQPTPFVVDVPDSTLRDMRARLSAARLPDQIPGSGWSYGTDTTYLSELITYWQTDHDWPSEQARLNGVSHGKADIDGLGLHFVHARSDQPDAIPLLMLHGWPSSFVQMLDIIPMLTSPSGDNPAFHVVAASLPGYGFSDIPNSTGLSPAAIAPYMHRLMTESLGYARYGVRSSDLGAGIAATMAATYGEAIIGSHTGGTNPYLGPDIPQDLSPEEQAFVQTAQSWMAQEMGYAIVQSSKPQTLAVALNDSPAGLASWIIEKFWRWTDHDGTIESAINRDALLTNLTIYWATQTINPSMRLYAEAARAPASWAPPQVPVGYLMPVNDLFETPRSWIERHGPVAHWTRSDVGGHFMEWEQPQIVAEDLRVFFSAL